jgi:acyl-CoA synthetase (NDP forming)
VVGASEREGSFGKRLWNAVTGGRFEGDIFPINPRYETFAGQACYPSLTTLPHPADLVAFAISDDLIEAGLEDAARAGCGAAAIFGRAYEEHREGRLSKSARLGAIARAAHMPVCGNNCMGFINFVDGLKVSGNPPPIPESAGTIGLVSHSGSTWSGLVGNQRQLDYNYAISAGQEIATTMADYINFLLDQTETRVIGCIMETVREPDAFLAAVERADSRGIPVVVLKLGRSERGRAMALAHSGALAGSDSAYGAVFERRNVIRVNTPDELTDTLEIFNSPRRPPATGVGIVTDSGGERELIVDIASDVEMPLAELAPGSIAELDRLLDPGMSPSNPVDAYGDGRTLLEEALTAVSNDPNVGIVALATNLVHGRPYLKTAIAAIEAVAAATSKPALVFGNLHSTISREAAVELRSKGVPVLMGVTTALLAMKHLGVWQRRHVERQGIPASSPLVAPAIDLAAMRARSGQALGPQDAFAILEAYDIPVAPSGYADSRQSCIALAARLGHPVVLKTASVQILHKSEAGGVMLNLGGDNDVAAAYDAIAARCGPLVQVQAQTPAGVEILLGMTNDPPFGPMLTVGLGGIFTEVLADVVTIEPPVTSDEAMAALDRLKGRRLLDGFRGRPAPNLDSLCSIISRFSALCATIGTDFAAIDVNPIIAHPSGAVAVDALMVLTEPGS